MNRRYKAGILPIRRKTLKNQSINQELELLFEFYGILKQKKKIILNSQVHILTLCCFTVFPNHISHVCYNLFQIKLVRMRENRICAFLLMRLGPLLHFTG